MSLSRVWVFALGAAILTTTGCSTGPVPISARRSVPSDRVFAPVLLSKSAERPASFTIVRDRGYAGSLVGIDVFIDGQRIARLATAETVTAYTTPGRHLVGARFSLSGPPGPVEREFIADPRRPLTIRIFTEAYAATLDLRQESGYLAR